MATHKSLVLVGMMGTGKSTIGKEVAKKLKIEFIDTDALIENETNQTIAEVFKKNGEKYFKNSNKKIYFNLRLFVNNKFLKLGIPNRNIDHINKDTYSDYKNFFSYRRSVHNNDSDYGRCISVICRY